ncbi:S41 family peptidase [Bacillus timonensis]|nr:S41 family peptidase [Bacillus timonensis]
MQHTETYQLSSEERHHIVKEMAEKLKAHYVFPELGEEICLLLLTNLNEGTYTSMKDANELCERLTTDIRRVNNDKHLKVIFKPDASSSNQEKSREEIEAEFKRRATVKNFGFYKVERLPGNIGYIDLRSFEDPTYSAPTAISAMQFVANTDALIFDLRKNGGGSPRMIQLLSTYLFDGMKHLNSFYQRETDSILQFWTLPYVQGERYLHKPVFVLTSNYTFSAAEEFTYNLKHMQRATIIGEITSGGANPGKLHQLNEHFRVFIPDGRAINPITETNWEGIGVHPDIEIEQEKALDVAYKKALKHVKSLYENKSEYAFLLKEINNELSKYKE